MGQVHLGELENVREFCGYLRGQTGSPFRDCGDPTSHSPGLNGIGRVQHHSRKPEMLEDALAFALVSDAANGDAAAQGSDGQM